MKSIKVCEYSRSRSFHYDLILQDQASGERSQDQWSSGLLFFSLILSDLINTHTTKVTIYLYNRLYGYRILSYSTLCLSVAKLHVIFYVNCLNFSVTFL